MKLVAALVLSATTAQADVDWARGLVTADGIGIADRHAPTPATARGPARRAAEDAAKKAIAAQLGDLPLAAGGTLKAKLADKAVKSRIDDAVARATAIAATLETDGSWKVTLGLPIEAVRIALDGDPRALGPKGDADPAIVVVEGAKQKPALGVTVNKTSAATLFVREPPAWAADAPRVKATAKAGAITLARSLGGPATLYVVLVN